MYIKQRCQNCHLRNVNHFLISNTPSNVSSTERLVCSSRIPIYSIDFKMCFSSLLFNLFSQVRNIYRCPLPSKFCTNEPANLSLEHRHFNAKRHAVPEQVQRRQCKIVCKNNQYGINFCFSFLLLTNVYKCLTTQATSICGFQRGCPQEILQF